MIVKPLNSCLYLFRINIGIKNKENNSMSGMSGKSGKSGNI